MQGSVGLKVMNSTNAEVNWNTVTKGRRSSSRKSTARSFNANSKAGDSISPKRVGDFSGSDSDKVSEAICGQSSSSKSENIPLKKRRHLLETPLRGQESTSSHIQRPVSENHGKPFSPSCSSGKKISNWQESATASAKVGFNKGFDHILRCEQLDRRYNEAEDFSGIALLAAAASMDEDNENDKKVDLIAMEDPTAPKESDRSSSAIQSELGLKGNKSENSSSNVLVNEGSADGSIATNSSAVASDSSCRSSLDVAAVPKANRQHWDLNTLMDAWDEPYDDSPAGKTSKDDEGLHIDSALSNTVGTGDELSDLKIEGCNAVMDSDPSNASSSKDDMEASHDPTEKGFDGKNSDQALSCDDHKQILNQVLKTDAPISSDWMSSKEKNNTLLDNLAVIKEEDLSSNLREVKTAAFSERIQTVAQDTGVSESPLTVELKDVKDPGTRIQDAQALVATDLRIGNDGALVPDSTNPDCPRPQLVEHIVKHEDDSFPDEGLKGVALEDSCKSSSAGPHCDDPASSVGKIGTFDTRRDSHLSKDDRHDASRGDGMTRFEEGYDSPYEDGELRGSFSYSWEDKELENECVDYESDGRNGDGRNAAGYPGPENVDDGSEGSHGTQRGRSSVKRLPVGCESKTGLVRHSLRYFSKDDSDNNERAGKGSNAGSGTTVEQSMEINADENDDIMKGRQLTGRREMDIKFFGIEGYASRMSRGKLHSRIEGRSFDGNHGKDAFYPQQFRSHRPGSFSYSRHERETSPDKQFVRYRPATHGEREGDRQLSTNWVSRRRYTSKYQAPDGGRMYSRPRSYAGDLDKIGEMDVHDPRQNGNYMSKGPNRPMMRSPPERDEYFGVRKRVPLSRGGGSYRSRGHYPQRGPGRDFREDLEPMQDDTGASPPIRFPRYMSRQDRSFSPGSGRGAGHMPLPGRKSRSRSRTRSPGAWRRERVMNGRRPSRSPDFRPEPRMRNMPFPKPGFTSDYGEEYISPSRARFSPQRSHPRWVEDHSFTENNVRRRRSPVRVFKRTPQRIEKYDFIGSSGRMKSDDYFRPMPRPGRYSFKPNGDGTGNGGGGGFREFKFESNRAQLHSDDGGNGTNIRNRFRHNGTGDDHETIKHSDDGGNVTNFRNRFRDNAAAGDDYGTNNITKDETQVADASQTQPNREDKQRSFKI